MICSESIREMELEVLSAFREVLHSAGMHGLGLESRLCVHVTCLTPLNEAERAEFYEVERTFRCFYPTALVEFSAPASKEFSGHGASETAAAGMTVRLRLADEGEPCKS